MLIYIVDNVFSEPTGKIAPKLPGQRYEGGKIYFSPSMQTVVLTCDVVGFPVPAFRLVLYFFQL